MAAKDRSKSCTGRVIFETPFGNTKTDGTLLDELANTLAKPTVNVERVLEEANNDTSRARRTKARHKGRATH